MNRATSQPGAVLYTRVSTGEQADKGTSLESQRQACRAKALALGLPIMAEYEDAGISGGFLTSRAGMMSAIADLQAGRANVLICANMSRFSRDSEHQQALLKSVRASGGRLVFCDMTFDDTPTGDMMFGMVGQFAQWEKSEIKRRTYLGHVTKAEKGLQPCRATSPYGLHIVGKADVLRGDYQASELGKYHVMEEAAAVVRELFELYAAGRDSLNDLSKMLNRRGLPTPGGGRMWRASNVRFMLTNPAYKGVGVFGRFDHATDENRLSRVHERTGLPLTCPKTMTPADPSTWITWEIPAIVSEELWQAANERLAVNKSLKGGNPARVRMLAGRVFCPVCGTGMSCSSPTKTKSKKPGSSEVFIYPHRYQCGHYRRALLNAGEKACEPTGFYVHEVEAATVEAIARAARTAEWLEAAKTTYRQALPAEPAEVDTAAAITAIDKALRALEGKQQAMVKAQIEGIMSGLRADAYNGAFAQLSGERAELEERRVTLERSHRGRKAGRQASEPADVESIIADVLIALQAPNLTGEEKRDLIGTVIERVVCLKQEDGHAGAEVTFLPGLFGEDTLQSHSELPEMRRLRAGKCQGSGLAPMGNSERTAPRPSAISSKR